MEALVQPLLPPKCLFRDFFNRPLRMFFVSDPVQQALGCADDTVGAVFLEIMGGVFDELRKRNPKNAKGARKQRHHQWLTEDIGHPKLREHIASVIALMKAATKWEDFKRMINRALPKWEDLPLFDQAKKRNA